MKFANETTVRARHADGDHGWRRVFAALRRDWAQTRQDFTNAPGGTDLHQDAVATVRQAFGREQILPAGIPHRAYAEASRIPLEEDVELSSGYDDSVDSWDEGVESLLRDEWHALSSGRLLRDAAEFAKQGGASQQGALADNAADSESLAH